MTSIVGYKNLVIIGTSHISKNSAEEVEKVIKRLNPSVVALELDIDRYNSLMTKSKTSFFSATKNLGFFNGLFVYFGGLIQSKLGKTVGVNPGVEMTKAIEEAKNIKARIALIDQHISITIKKLNLGFLDITRLLVDAIFSGIKNFFGFGDNEELINFDISKVPKDDIVEKLINKLKQKYPKYYNVLIDDRNKIMTDNLIKIMKDNRDSYVVAVIGAGHKKEVIKGVKDYFESLYKELDV